LVVWNDPEPQTVRPRNEVVSALESAAPIEAFLGLLRQSLQPGAWEESHARGFSWIPYRLRHTVDGGITPSGPVCRSKIGLVSDISDEKGALDWASRLNLRGLGGAVFYEPDSRSLWLVASTRLDPRRWWNAFLFREAVTRHVGLAEHLAPRLADAIGGKLMESSHERLGERSSPDQLYFEHAVETYQPEASTGLWWSESEQRRISFLFGHIAKSSKGSGRASIRRDGVLVADALLPVGRGRVAMRLQEIDHPDFGFGPQVSISTSFVPDRRSRSRSLEEWALVHANLMNQRLFDAAPAALTLGGWAGVDGRVVFTTYFWPQVVRMLQYLGIPTTADLWTLVLYDVVENVPRESGIGTMKMAKKAPEVWSANLAASGFSLLTDESYVADKFELSDGMLTDRVELGFEEWCLASKTLVTFGLFNPAGPSIGSIEIIDLRSAGKVWLVQRTRHPSQPSMVLLAVFARQRSDVLSKSVEEAIANLQWDRIDWMRIRDHQYAASAKTGLKLWAASRAMNFGAIAASIRRASGNPWNLVDRPLVESGESPGPGIDEWVRQVTDPGWVSGCSAYMRSAWDPSAALLQSPLEAERLHNVRMVEIDRRIGP
jgi:hypothetical protein